MLREKILKLTKDSFFDRVEIIHETNSILKARIFVNPFLFIQIYNNSKMIKQSFTLILENNRIFGWDYYKNSWHYHPFDNPELHIPHPPAGGTTFEDFISECKKIIIENNLL